MRVASQCELAKTLGSLRVREFESGSKTIPTPNPRNLDLVCWRGGRCEGRLLDSFPAALESECLDACKAAGPDGCAWFSYHEADGVCSLLADCGKLDSDGCDSCWSGQRQCAQRKGGVGVQLISIRDINCRCSFHFQILPRSSWLAATQVGNKGVKY